MKSKLSKKEKRRRAILKGLRAAIKDRDDALASKAREYEALKRRLAAQPGTAFSDCIVSLRAALRRAEMEKYDYSIMMDVNECYAEVARRIVRIDGFRAGYDYVMDFYGARSQEKAASLLSKVTSDMAHKLAVIVIDHIIKNTPEVFRR